MVRCNFCDFGRMHPPGSSFCGRSFICRCSLLSTWLLFGEPESNRMNLLRKKNLVWLGCIAVFALLLWGLVIFLMILRGPAQAM